MLYFVQYFKGNLTSSFNGNNLSDLKLKLYPSGVYGRKVSYKSKTIKNFVPTMINSQTTTFESLLSFQPFNEISIFANAKKKFSDNLPFVAKNEGDKVKLTQEILLQIANDIFLTANNPVIVVGDVTKGEIITLIQFELINNNFYEIAFTQISAKKEIIVS